MKRRPLPAQSYLRECLDYNPETGKLTWRTRPLHHFKDGAQTAQHNCNAWNGGWAGKEAFTAIAPNGYVAGGLDRVIYRAHRIIWKLVHNEEPEDVDHINGDRADNRLCNLRAATRSENMRNSTLRKDNTSGVIGVSRARGKWLAQIKADRHYFLGYFDTVEEAAAARRAAEREHGFHENHGRKQEGAPWNGYLPNGERAHV